MPPKGTTLNKSKTEWDLEAQTLNAVMVYLKQADQKAVDRFKRFIEDRFPTKEA